MITNQLNNNNFINSPLPNNPNTTTTTINYPYIVIKLNPESTLLSDSLAKKQAAKELVFDRFKEVLSKLD